MEEGRRSAARISETGSDSASQLEKRYGATKGVGCAGSE